MISSSTKTFDDVLEKIRKEFANAGDLGDRFEKITDLGKQINKYCGKLGTDQAELVALKTERKSFQILRSNTDNRIVAIDQKYERLLKKTGLTDKQIK